MRRILLILVLTLTLAIAVGCASEGDVGEVDLAAVVIDRKSVV